VLPVSVRAAVLLLLACGVPAFPACDRAPAPQPVELAPRGIEPGRRLPWPALAEPVRDWGFAAGEEEIAIETRGPRGEHSVTVWCAVVGGRLYVATDSSARPKRWVGQLARDPQARVGIRERVYPVRARAVRDQVEWDAVTVAFTNKYAQSIGKYDFPRAGDTSRGRIFELQSHP
jgi:hypothetical protein